MKQYIDQLVRFLYWCVHNISYYMFYALLSYQVLWQLMFLRLLKMVILSSYDTFGASKYFSLQQNVDPMIKSQILLSMPYSKNFLINKGTNDIYLNLQFYILYKTHIKFLWHVSTQMKQNAQWFLHDKDTITTVRVFQT